ncbi:MAG: DNA internalization-related competence protein ComEC/Rec2 [Gammaproteobacteria bacterium]
MSILAFCIAVLLVQQLPVLCPSPWLYGAGIVTVSACWKRRSWPLLFFTAGFMLSHYDAQLRLNARLQPQLQGIDLAVEGVVASLPEIETHSVRFNFDVTRSIVQLPAHLRLSWYYPQQTPKAGQRWHFTVRLKRPHGSFNPGGFDYERWLLRQDIGASGYVRVPAQARLLGDGGFAYTILRWRQRLSDRLEELFPESQNIGLIKALTLGDGHSITEKQWDAFRQTGTVHLMVISGAHIALVAGWIYFIVRRLWAFTGCLRYPPQNVAVFAALCGAIAYTLLAGFAIPARRALIMVVVGLLAVLGQRRVLSGHTLALAALLVTAIQPSALLVPGFWLSFAAVGLIAYVLAGRLRRNSVLLSAIKIQWAMALGLTPLLLLFFQQVSLLSLPANFVAVPLVGFVAVPLALLAVLLLPLYPPVSRWLLQIVDLSLGGLDAALNFLLRMPFTSVSHPQPALWALLSASLGAFILLAPRGIPSRWLGFVLWLPLLFPLREEIEGSAVKMTLLDVGQGLSAVLQTRTHCLVFDTGAKFSDSFDMGQAVLLPFLRSQGIAKLDEVIVSHGDNDHRGGLEALLQGIATAQLSSSDSGVLQQYNAKPCAGIRQWQWDDVTFTLLAPPNGVFVKENDNSCVLKVDSAYGSILLPGDIEAEAEIWLTNNFRRQLQADILVAPHHGSKTSSTTTFLRDVKPHYILIPAGYRNRFGFPHATVLRRYRQIGAVWLSSADAGAITVLLSNKGKRVSAFRETDGRYWNE